MFTGFVNSSQALCRLAAQPSEIERDEVPKQPSESPRGYKPMMRLVGIEEVMRQDELPVYVPSRNLDD